MGKLAGNHSFQCSTNLIIKEKQWPPFYQQVFAAWIKFLKSPDDDSFNIRREIIWWNKNIQINKKEILYKEWLDSGIITLHDILQENGEFRSKQSLEQEFGIDIDIMKYNGLKSAIPDNDVLKP